MKREKARSAFWSAEERVDVLGAAMEIPEQGSPTRSLSPLEGTVLFLRFHL